MAPNTISSLQLEKLLEINAKSIEMNTIVSSQFESIEEQLKLLSDCHKETSHKIDDMDKKLLKLNIILGSTAVTAILGIIILLVKIITGSP